MGDCSSSIAVLVVGTSSALPSLTHGQADYYMVRPRDQNSARATGTGICLKGLIIESAGGLVAISSPEPPIPSPE